MNTILSKTAIGLAAALAFGASAPAFATTLNGTFTINIYNFSDGGLNGDVTETNSAATAANVANAGFDATVTYTGDLAFGIGSGGSDTTSIWDFLVTGGGIIGVDASTQLFLESTLLSQGTYVTTTFFEIIGSFATDVLAGTISHDDGVMLSGENVTGGVSPAPTTVVDTAFTADAGDFTLIYAAANGNPSILVVDATLAPVPVPAGGLLLICALGGLAALRRRKLT
jgi:hypothetical protein